MQVEGNKNRFVELIDNAYVYLSQYQDGRDIAYDKFESILLNEYIFTLMASHCHFNPLTTRNTQQCNQKLVSLVAADDLVLKHQVITILNPDFMPIVPHQLHREW